MSDAQKPKTSRSHCFPASPTSEESCWEETSTDISSSVDLETAAHVSHLIDSLQERSPVVPESLGVLDASRSQFRTETTMRYQFLLANARDAMAASPIAKSFAPRSEPKPHRASFAVTTNSDLDSVEENCSPSVQGSIESHQMADGYPVTSSQAEDRETKGAHAQLQGGNQFTNRSQNAMKDVHYYAILAQIQKVVRSDSASVSLGKILADANKRGMSLDVVTEIYKQERFKASSQKESCDDTEPGDSNKSSRGSSHAVIDVESDLVEACSDPPLGTAASTTKEVGGNARHNVVKNSLSSEIADGMMELSRLCDQASALFKDNSIDNLSIPRISSDAASEGATSPAVKSFVDNETTSLEVDHQKQAPSGSDNSSTSFGASVASQSKTSSTVDTHENPTEINTAVSLPEVLTHERRQGLLTSQLMKLNETECHVPVRTGSSDADDVAGYKNPAAKIMQDVFSNSDLSPMIIRTPSHNLVGQRKKEGVGDISVPGPSEPQTLQLKHLAKTPDEPTGTNISPQGCIDDVTKQSLGIIPSSESYPVLHGHGRRNSTMQTHAEYPEDIDAFLLRFSIQEDGELIASSPRKGQGKAVDSEHGENCADLIGESMKDQDGSNSHCQGLAKNECVSLKEDVEVTEPAEKESPQKKARKSKPKYHSGEGSNDLPKHLGLWKSPWHRSHIASSDCSDDLNLSPTDRIPDAGSFHRSPQVGKQRQCFLPLAKRLVGHNGYSNIDFYSLYEATLVRAEDEDIDQAPWEYRDVGQRFLHEKSLESRNWFGSFQLKRGNDRVPNPVCRPKSLEVLVTKIPEPGEWCEGWYTTWKSRRENPNNLVTFSQDESVKANENRLYANSSIFQQDCSPSVKKVAVEIGSLCPVRGRGGEQRVSRIHPEFTSSLRRSRWRKKYLKGSLFPSD